MSNLQFTEKEYNSFLKEYIINKKVNPNKENLEIFQKFSATCIRNDKIYIILLYSKRKIN